MKCVGYNARETFKLICAMFFIFVALSLGDLSYAESGGTINGLSWRISDEGILEIAGEGKIPAFPRGAWLEHADKIQKIVIHNGVTAIGSSAFDGCSNVTSISLPESITAIEGWAFKDCSSMTELNIPDEVKSIDIWAFQQCRSLQEITFPDNLTYVGNDAFWGCPAKRYANLGTLAAEAISKAGYSFTTRNYNYNLQYQFSDDKVMGLAIYDFDKAATSFTIPSYITHIGNYAFNDCSSLEQVIIPDSVVDIGEHAFSKCNKLSNIIIPDSVTSIGAYAFNNCQNLKRVKLPCGLLKLEEHVFSGCSNLKDVSIPRGAISLGDSVFSGCSSLTNVVIPEGVTYVGGGAFYYCTKLETITIADSVEIIGAWAFYNCSNLKSVSIPENVIEIREKAFYWCHNLSKVAFFQPENKKVTFGEEVFTNRPTVYCYEYSDPDSWAIDSGYDIVNFERLSDFDTIRVLTMPESIRMAEGTEALVNLNIFPDEKPLVIWTSSNEEVVTVAGGILTAVGRGEAKVTASIGTVFEDIAVTVYKQVESFDLSESDVWLIAKETVTLSATNILPECAEASFNWSSSNTNLATVDQNGVVTTKKPGDVTISAISDNGIRRDCILHLCYRVSNIVFFKNVYITDRSTPIQILANVTMNTQSCSNHLIRFSSDNVDVAVVDEKTGIVTPVGAGRTTIRAEAINDATIAASCTLIVKGTILLLPSELTRIESEAFANDAFIDGVEIPPHVMYIAEDAFGVRNRFIIIGTVGTEAELFADRHDGYTFISTDEYYSY